MDTDLKDAPNGEQREEDPSVLPDDRQDKPATLEEDAEFAELLTVVDLEPDWLLERMRPILRLNGVGKTTVDESAFRAIAHDIAEQIRGDADISTEEKEVERLRFRLTPAGLADQIKSAIKAPELLGFSAETPGESDQRIRRMLKQKGDEVSPEVGNAVRPHLEKTVEDLVHAAKSALRKAPRRGVRLVKDTIEEIEAGLAENTKWTRVEALEAIGHRWTSFESSASQVNARAREKVRSAFKEATRDQSIKASRQVREAVAHKELRKWVAHIRDALETVSRRAGEVVRFQEEVVRKLKRSGPGDTSGRRSVVLPTPNRNETLKRILKSRGCRDLAELAEAYRQTFGGLSPTSLAEAADLAQTLVDRVRSDSGGQCDYALIASEERARHIARELYARAHPHGALRFADSRVGAEVYQISTAEIPLANPGYESIREALIQELQRLDNKIGIVDLPAQTSGLRVFREVGGLFAINFRALPFLRTGYLLSAKHGPHEPHPPWSRLVGTPGGYLGCAPPRQ